MWDTSARAVPGHVRDERPYRASNSHGPPNIEYIYYIRILDKHVLLRPLAFNKAVRTTIAQ